MTRQLSLFALQLHQHRRRMMRSASLKLVDCCVSKIRVEFRLEPHYVLQMGHRVPNAAAGEFVEYVKREICREVRCLENSVVTVAAAGPPPSRRPSTVPRGCDVGGAFVCPGAGA